LRRAEPNNRHARIARRQSTRTDANTPRRLTERRPRSLLPEVRIALVCPGFPLDGDLFGAGVAGFVARLHAIHSVHVFSVRPLAARSATSRGLPVFSPRAAAKSLRFIELTARALKQPAFDAIWCMWPDRTGAISLFWSAALRVPLIVSVMGRELEGHKRVLLERVLSRARMVTVGSSWLRERLRRDRPWLDPVVTPIGVESSPRVERAERWTGGPLRVATIGGSDPVKRMTAIFEAIDFLRRKNIDVVLELYTLNPDHCALEHPHTRVHKLAHSAMAAALSSAHVLVHASMFESQGLALIEAALVRLPIVSTRVGVAEELGELGAAIKLVDEVTPATLGEAILEMAALSGGPREAIAAELGLEPCVARFAGALEHRVRTTRS
jgi:glycosyltransferase involved in cell wall biosynthesis